MKVSVCIATYNGESYIKAQVESILVQLSCCDEIVVSDDGSKDLTLNIITDIGDNRIKILHNTQHQGITHNIENALWNVSGDIIFLSDQDDVWLDGKVAKTKELLRECDLVISNCKVTDKDLLITNESFFEMQKSGSGLLKNIYKNTYIGCCMAFNIKVLNAALPLPPDIPMHDSWIGLVAELVGKVSFLDDPLILYRRHENNASTTSQKSYTSLCLRIKWRYIMIRELFIRYYEIRSRFRVL